MKNLFNKKLCLKIKVHNVLYERTLSNLKYFFTNFGDLQSINIILSSILLIIQINCQSQSKVIRDEQDIDESSLKIASKSDKISMRTTGITDWNSSKEGFVDSSTFQIKISSLKTSKTEALE